MKLIPRFNMDVSLILLLVVIGACCAELRLLMSVFRHGNRYPISHDTFKSIYPRSPYNDDDWFPNSPEGLTNAGKFRAYELGKLLRERYRQWLGEFYSSDLVTFRSSPPERCVATALLVAAGLFPPSDDQRWNRNLDWQPIPVQQYPRENTLFRGAIDCETFLKTVKSTRHTDSVILEYDKRMQYLYDDVSNHTGLPSVDNTILHFLGTEFTAVVDIPDELPPWAKTIYDNGYFTKATINEHLFSSWTDELKQWTGGVWIKEWLNHVDAYLTADNVISEECKRKRRFKKKASFYAGHDVNIAGILVTLGIYDREVPDYTSAVNFELHDDDNGQFYVKMLHKNSGNFIERIVPGCGSTLCPLNTFKDIFKSLILLNATEKCGRHIRDDDPDDIYIRKFSTCVSYNFLKPRPIHLFKAEKSKKSRKSCLETIKK